MFSLSLHPDGSNLTSNIYLFYNQSLASYVTVSFLLQRRNIFILTFIKRGKNGYQDLGQQADLTSLARNEEGKKSLCTYEHSKPSCLDRWEFVDAQLKAVCLSSFQVVFVKIRQQQKLLKNAPRLTELCFGIISFSLFPAHGLLFCVEFSSVCFL